MTMGLPRLALFCPGSSTSQGSIEPAAGCLSRPRDANETVMIYTQIKQGLLVAVLSYLDVLMASCPSEEGDPEQRFALVQSSFSLIPTPPRRDCHTRDLFCARPRESLNT